jgi:hypothetical protein
VPEETESKQSEGKLHMRFIGQGIVDARQFGSSRPVPGV